MRINLYLYCLLTFLLYGCHTDNDNYLSLSNDMMTFGWKSDTKELTINSDTHWLVSSDLPSWISLGEPKRGQSSFVLYITVADNDTGEYRKARVTFTISGQEKTLLILQTAKEKLHFVDRKTYQVNESDTILAIDVEQNVDYGVYISTNAREWINQSDYGNQVGILNNVINVGRQVLTLRISENTEREKRYAKVAVYNKEYNLSDTIYIIQQPGNSKQLYGDGAYLQLQAAQSGSVNLIVMGDGFIRKDMTLGGTYEQVMRQAVDNFFSIEPYTTYRDYFNVYMVAAESEEAGVGEKGGVKPVRNKFGTAFGSGTEIVCNSDLILEYARKVEELPSDRPLSVIVVLNSTKYAGTTYMYSNGNSIALCPMSAKDSPNDFEGLVHHEAGGHGFGFLCDEYIYYDRNIPEDEKRNIKEWQKLGFQMNLDFTDNLSAILWKDFIGQPGYEPVGAFEGGSQYQYGVWRPEKNSCMNNNIPYFNVQSRWNIVRRIMKLSGMDISVREFMEKDKPVYPSEAVITRAASDFIPLGNPVWIK